MKTVTEAVSVLLPRPLLAVTVTATLAVDVHWKRSLLQLESETQLEPMGQQRGWLCLLT